MKHLFLVSQLISINIIFLSAQSPDMVRDVDGNTYKTVTIGKQEWMAENLKTTNYNDGTNIPFVTEEKQWGNLISPGYSWYDNESINKNNYGALYNWYTVNTGKLCPVGWHIPSNAEWSALTSTLNGVGIPGGDILMKGELKSTRTVPDNHPRWNEPNSGATDNTGFAALPGGMRIYLGIFDYVGKFGFFWSSDESSGWYRGMRYDNSDVFLTNGHKNNGLSVRCMRVLK